MVSVFTKDNNKQIKSSAKYQAYTLFGTKVPRKEWYNTGRIIYTKLGGSVQLSSSFRLNPYHVMRYL